MPAQLARAVPISSVAQHGHVGDRRRQLRGRLGDHALRVLSEASPARLRRNTREPAFRLGSRRRTGVASAAINLSGLSILVDPATAVVLPSFATNAGNLALPIPNNPGFVGVTLRAQAFVLDAASAAFGLASSNGLTLSFARSGLLIVPRSIGGSADPQVSIDLATGTQANFSGGQGEPARAIVTCGGRSSFGAR